MKLGDWVGCVQECLPFARYLILLRSAESSAAPQTSSHTRRGAGIILDSPRAIAGVSLEVNTYAHIKRKQRPLSRGLQWGGRTWVERFTFQPGFSGSEGFLYVRERYLPGRDLCQHFHHLQSRFLTELSAVGWNSNGVRQFEFCCVRERKRWRFPQG